MDLNWLTPKAHAEPAGAKGWASYADEAIAAGETVAAFGGYSISRAELDKLNDERIGRSLQIDGDLYLLSAETREPGDCVNHSCAPNCGIRGSLLVVAMRDIAVGEELTFDYAMADASDYDEFSGACGAEVCRGTVSGTDWQRTELRARYAGWFGSYVQHLIDSAAH